MIKRLIVRYLAIGATASLVLGSGVASASTIFINNTGPFSYNSASISSTTTIHKTNFNFVDVDNSNSQTATSGNANVLFNTNGGWAWTGNASNWNNTFTVVGIHN